MDQNLILQTAAQLSVRQKLWGGFSLILLILVAITSVTLYGINKTQEKVDLVTAQIQPTLIASTALDSAVKQAATSLGLFLLSNDDSRKLAFHRDLIKIDSAYDALEQATTTSPDQNTRAQVAELYKDIKLFRDKEAVIIHLAEDRLKNFPAMEYARLNLNPLNTEITQIISGMIESESEEEATTQRKLHLISLANLKGTWANVTINIRVYLYLSNADAKANIDLFLEGTLDLINKIVSSDVELTFEQEEGLETMQTLLGKWKSGYASIIEIAASDKARMDAYVIKTEIGPLLSSISKKLALLVEGQTRLTLHTGTELSSDAAINSRAVIILLVVGLSIGFILACMLTQVIVLPLRMAASAMEDIADGDGDLTQRLAEQGKDEISQLAGGFNRFATKIQNLMLQVSTLVQHLSTSAEEMSSSTEQSTKMINTQRDETAAIATAITEMSETAQAVTNDAERAATSAENANSETQQSRKVFDQALTSVQELSTDIELTSTVIEALGNDIHAIGSVIDFIRGITDQTNLLALNAAIEAARAGEHGRGFAVVADEVRSLADKTKQSTTEIQSKIEGLQKEASSAVKRMTGNRDAAINVVETAAAADKSLRAASDAVFEISDMTKQIATAALQQSAVADDVGIRVDKVSKLAAQVSSAAKGITDCSEGLETLSSDMKKIVSQYKY